MTIQTGFAFFAETMRTVSNLALGTDSLNSKLISNLFAHRDRHGGCNSPTANSNKRIQMNESTSQGGNMKKLMMATMILIGSLGIQQAASADGTTKTVELRVSDAVIPTGQTSSTDSYVVVTGWFPNGCYTWAYAQTTNLPGNVTEVESFANVRSGMCPMVMIPFHQNVELGKLTAGIHFIRFINSDGTYLEEQMTIE